MLQKQIYRWAIVAAGGLLGCIAIGAMFCLPVFLFSIAQDTGWSTTGISTAMTIGFLALAIASPLWGTLSDRLGPCLVILTGSVLLAAGLALASKAPSLVVFQLTFGLLVGAAGAAIMVPIMASVTGWFDTHRSLAVSLVSAGMGVAPMTMSPLAAWLVDGHDWRSAMLIIAGIVAVSMIPLSFLIRRPPALAEPAVASPEMTEQPSLSLAEALKSRQFIILALTNFFCCATHSGPIFHTVSYAVTCGIPVITAATIYSLEGLTGLGGRVAFGLLGDKLGAKRVLVWGLLAQAFGALIYAFASNLGTFYAAAAVFGFIYGGIMPLYAVIVRENFPLHMMGTVIGGTTMAGGLGMATGPVAGGFLHDVTGSYIWLYVGSFALGTGAFLIALTFKPFPKKEIGLSRLSGQTD